MRRDLEHGRILQEQEQKEFAYLDHRIQKDSSSSSNARCRLARKNSFALPRRLRGTGCVGPFQPHRGQPSWLYTVITECRNDAPSAIHSECLGVLGVLIAYTVPATHEANTTAVQKFRPAKHRLEHDVRNIHDLSLAFEWTSCLNSSSLWLPT